MSGSSTLETPTPAAPAEHPPNGSETGVAGGQPAAPVASQWQRAPRISKAQVQAVAVQVAGVVRVAAVIAVFFIGLGIVFQVLSANPHKWLVSDLESAGKWLASPFRDTFMVHDAKLRLSLNWGIALVVYVILGRVVAKVVQALPERVMR